MTITKHFSILPGGTVQEYFRVVEIRGSAVLGYSVLPERLTAAQRSMAV